MTRSSTTGSASATSSAAEDATTPTADDQPLTDTPPGPPGPPNERKPRRARETPAAERVLGDERGRYSRRTAADRAREVRDAARAHPVATIVVALFLGVVVLQLVGPGRSAVPADLRVGDCLYVRTGAALSVGQGARPIGDPAVVEAVLMAGDAEQAPCNGSHGHEVEALVGLALPLASGVVPTRDDLRGFVQRACEQAFPGYVGHPLVGSVYETFAVVPTSAEWAAGSLTGICLVARRDGQWMTHPARGSGE